MRSYLIDTQILIWSIISPNKLTDSVTEILLNNVTWVSQVSLFEIAIKQKIEKLPEFTPSTKTLLQQMSSDGFRLLPIKNEHVSAYDAISLFLEHRDPFDRLILATAFSEVLPVVSADSNFELYTDQIQLVEN